MLKLRFSKPSIKTYKDGRLTVCRYNCTLYDNCTKVIIKEFTTTGTATCAEGDVLNVSFGTKLADSRAKKEAYRVAYNLIKPEDIERMYKEIERNVELINFISSMQYLKNKETEHIKYLNAELSE